VVGVEMDGASCMAGKNSGLSMLIAKYIRLWFVYHCLKHQGNLCTKSIKKTNVIAIFAKYINLLDQTNEPLPNSF
jgi:hypothetical protein